MPHTRVEIEEMYQATDGRAVKVGDEETVGHFVVEPEVQFDHATVVGDVPTLVVPQMVPGLRIEAEVSVELTEEDLVQLGTPEAVPGFHSFTITRRLPAEAPGETRLVLRRS